MARSSRLSNNTFPLRLPRSVKAEVERRAKEDGGDYWAQRQAAYEASLPLFEKALEPIRGGLQASALLLLDRMIAVGKENA